MEEKTINEKWEIKTLQCAYSLFDNEKQYPLRDNINEIGWENILQIIPMYGGGGESFFTIIYRVKNED